MNQRIGLSTLSSNEREMESNTNYRSMAEFLNTKTLLGSISLDTRICPDLIFTEARGEYENQVRINLRIQTCGS